MRTDAHAHSLMEIMGRDQAQRMDRCSQEARAPVVHGGDRLGGQMGQAVGSCFR